MKRFLCILLCLLLAMPAALAETYTPGQIFRRQFITGGNGLRGNVSLTVSGVAEWLDVLMPFTATKLRMRVIGKPQGDESDLLKDDENWQVQMYVRDSNDELRGITWLYGDPAGIYLQSELLPDTLLSLPVKDVNLPYQLADGEFLPLLIAFDALGLANADESANAEVYSALGGLTKISGEDFNESWEPVLDKYDTEIDMWLARYASPTVLSGSVGDMTLRTTYDIPAEDVKAQAKYIISVMMYDYDLQTLLIPYVTDEQRSLYLNPAMIWFYEHCIDVIPLTGSILLEREMTLLGETTAMTISLPLPPLPEELTAPIGEAAANLFGLPYQDVFSGMDRISIRQTEGELSVSLTSPARTISLIVDEAEESEESTAWNGFLRVTPAVNSEDPPLSAAFTCKSGHSIWQDEDYSTHEDLMWSLSIEPDLSQMAEDDPFHSRYVDFTPVAFSANIGYLKKDKPDSPVQLSLDVKAVLSDAEIGLTGKLKTEERWDHEVLPITGMEDLSGMPEARLMELKETLIRNTVTIMTTLDGAPAAQ